MERGNLLNIQGMPLSAEKQEQIIYLYLRHLPIRKIRQILIIVLKKAIVTDYVVRIHVIKI